MKKGSAQGLKALRLFGEEMYEDPYPTYHALREREPVYWNDVLQAWVLTRYEDVTWALTRLSSDRVTSARDRFQDAAWRPLFDVLATLMLQRDEPDHARIRSLVQQAFLRTSVERWADSIQRRVHTLLQAGLRHGAMDFIWDFAVPLPILVISEIVGIPEADRDRVKQWCDDFALVAANFYANISADQLERGWHSTTAFHTYLATQVDEVHRAPRDDLLSALVHAEEDGVGGGQPGPEPLPRPRPSRRHPAHGAACGVRPWPPLLRRPEGDEAAGHRRDPSPHPMSELTPKPAGDQGLPSRKSGDAGG
jgi:cytochrome P450